MAVRLSVVVPVFNERNTIQEIVSAIRAVPVSKEVILVDDGSSDGTREMMHQKFEGFEDVQVLLHPRNYGKGKAVQTGIQAASGEALVIQDADLEYDPMDYLKLLDALEKESTNVVYGSRFLCHKKASTFWHRSVNHFLTWFTNFLFSSQLTDMETCYKLFSTRLLKNLKIESKGFEIEVELTAKILKAQERIVEVPISYKGRSFHEGKKIGWRDGIKAVFALIRYRFFKE